MPHAQIAVKGVTFAGTTFVPSESDLTNVLMALGFNGEVTGYDSSTGTLYVSVVGSMGGIMCSTPAVCPFVFRTWRPVVLGSRHPVAVLV